MVELRGNISDFATDIAFENPDRRVFVVHGCNCFHKMESGISKQLKEDFAGVLAADRTTPYGDEAKLGTYSMAKQSKNLSIINLYTQYRYGRGKYLNYEALQKGLERLTTKLRPADIVLYPKIGAGASGGGSWIKIHKIINSTMEGFDHRLVILGDTNDYN